MTTYKQALDGAEAVKVEGTDIVVWHGGVTFNVYHTEPPERNKDLHGIDNFGVSDKKGQPVSRDTAVEHMEDYLERVNDV